MPKKSSTSSKKFKKRSSHDLVREILSLRMPRCSVCGTGWYTDDNGDDRGKTSLDERVKKLIPMPHCECSSTLIQMPSNLILPSIIDRAEVSINQADEDTPGAITNFLMNQFSLRGGESSSIPHIRDFPKKGMCMRCLERRVAASEEVVIHEYRSEQQPDVKFSVPLDCTICRQKFSRRTLDSILQGRKTKVDEKAEWWNCVKDTVRAVQFIKKLRSLLRNEKAEINDTIVESWLLEEEDNHSSDECFSDSNSDVRPVKQKTRTRIESKPGELKDELSMKDPKFRKECEDKAYIQDRLKTKEGRFELGLETVLDYEQERERQEQNDLKLAQELQKEMEKEMEKKIDRPIKSDKPGRSRSKPDFFHPPDHTPQSKSTRNPSSQESGSTSCKTIQTTNKNCGGKARKRPLKRPRNKVNGAKKQNSISVESSSIHKHFRDASIPKKPTSHKRSSIIENSNATDIDATKRNSSVNPIYLTPYRALCDSSCSSTSSSAPSSQASNVIRLDDDDSIVEKRGKSSNCTKKRYVRRNPVRKNGTGKRRANKLSPRGSQDIIDIDSDSGETKDGQDCKVKENHECNRVKTNLLKVNAKQSDQNPDMSKKTKIIPHLSDPSCSSSSSSSSSSSVIDIRDIDAPKKDAPRYNKGKTNSLKLSASTRKVDEDPYVTKKTISFGLRPDERATKDSHYSSVSVMRETQVNEREYSTSSSTIRTSAVPSPCSLIYEEEKIRYKPDFRRFKKSVKGRSTNIRGKLETAVCESDDEMSDLTHSTGLFTQDNSIATVDSQALSTLIDLGFERARCVDALNRAKNNQDIAANILISENESALVNESTHL